MVTYTVRSIKYLHVVFNNKSVKNQRNIFELVRVWFREEKRERSVDDSIPEIICRQKIFIKTMTQRYIAVPLKTLKKPKRNRRLCYALVCNILSVIIFNADYIHTMHIIMQK